MGRVGISCGKSSVAELGELEGESLNGVPCCCCMATLAAAL